MSGYGRYWLFFVIVAVGLALSWAQIGRKTHRVLEEAAVVYLVNERPCQPRIAPCAALAGDRALVLGPAAGGLALKHTGLSLTDLISGEAVFVAGDGSEIGRRNLRLDAPDWLLGGIPESTQRLRIRLTGNREVTVGDFPLR